MKQCAVVELPALTTLCLADVGVTNEGVIASIPRCTQLQRLDLNRTQVNQQIFPALQGQWPLYGQSTSVYMLSTQCPLIVHYYGQFTSAHVLSIQCPLHGQSTRVHTLSTTRSTSTGCPIQGHSTSVHLVSTTRSVYGCPHIVLLQIIYPSN